ncbi:MAG: hypothetical protein LUC25_06865 [Ruminococcus sp.]|nr:hypothetical protein [Ruminococcus sp.]
MKRILAALCALSLAAVMCACEDVPVDEEYTAETTTTTTTTTTTESADDLLDDSADTDSDESSDDDSSAEEATEEAEETSVNTDAVEGLTYSTWTQSNTNAKVEIAERLLAYIEIYEGEISMESSELISELNAVEDASDEDGLLEITYGILGIEE